MSISSILNIIIKGQHVKTDDYVRVVSNDINHVCSFFKYLVTPANFKCEAPIIDHELTHIKQRHSWDLILSEITKSILWCNPMAYLMQKSVKLNHEYICDDRASRMHGVFEYATLLGNHADAQSKFTVVSNFSYKLKNRIR
mgnify:CR=1 FL=1